MKILLAISGGIAAYKTPDLVRQLHKAGHQCQCIMTEAAQHLVSVHALAAVSNHRVLHSLWTSDGSMPHIDLARCCDLFLLAPATADCLAKCALGLADDLVSTTFLALEPHKHCVIAPAMNSVMWCKPIVQSHVQTLRSQGVHCIDPHSGVLACGEEGIGAMADAAAICSFIATISATA